ncbi:MAG: EcoAI/FtnUII family type I restriction enzme subunit R [Draconibacterium sp.]
MPDLLHKKHMSEEEIKMNFITPDILAASWDLQRQIRAEYTFTDGRVIVRGKFTARGEKKRADYVLFFNDQTSKIALAVVEAKDNKHSVGAGLQQAIDYAILLDAPFAYSANGDGFIEHDMMTGLEREIPAGSFPTPNALWSRFKGMKHITGEQEKIISEPYYFETGGNSPRYYQRIAINRCVEAVAKGEKRIFLVMATGTGKTMTAFQIIYRLKKAGKVNRVLYLADRNILIDQTMANDFKPFEKIMTKVEDRKLDSAYEVYMSLYHQLAGDENNEPFRQFTPDFFDLIFVDECHRGSARDESRWRKVLDYFTGATHIGMTATPKETKDISNSFYFGEPLYTYSLKQGIDDGFLAPYKVVRIGLDKDLEGYRPEAGKIDVNGYLIEDREYNSNDFDRKIILDKRTLTIANKISEFLKKTNRFDKTIVFCVDIDHAERMRQALVNENADLVAKNPKYVMRITGDNNEGKAQLDNFIALKNSGHYPVIVTTSRLMSTGVDCKTVKLIVLDNIYGENGMTEFKQIIGRGTRLAPKYGKEFFTIMDFRNASRLFADNSFNDDPVQIYEPGPDDSPVPPDDETVKEPYGVNTGHDDPRESGGDIIGDPPINYPPKYRVNDVEVKVISERVQYYDKDGKLITESLKDYTKRNILDSFSTLESFLHKWNSEERKEAIIEELKSHGVLLEALRDLAGNKDLDDFDLICHLAFDKKPLTKAERVNNVKKKGYLYQHSEMAQQVIDALLDKYMEKGIAAINPRILENDPFRKLGSPAKIASLFGGKAQFGKLLNELRTQIYA